MDTWQVNKCYFYFGGYLRRGANRKSLSRLMHGFINTANSAQAITSMARHFLHLQGHFHPAPRIIQVCRKVRWLQLYCYSGGKIWSSCIPDSSRKWSHQRLLRVRLFEREYVWSYTGGEGESAKVIGNFSHVVIDSVQKASFSAFGCQNGMRSSFQLDLWLALLSDLMQQLSANIDCAVSEKEGRSDFIAKISSWLSPKTWKEWKHYLR